MKKILGLCFQQSHCLVTVAEVAGVDIVVLQEFEEEVAKMGGLIEDGMGLVFVAASSDDRGKVVAGVIGGVAEVAADEDGGVVKKCAVAFRDLIEVGEELIEVFEQVNLDATEFFQGVFLATVMGKGVPASGGSGDFDRTVDPVEREGEDAGRVGLKGELGEFE